MVLHLLPRLLAKQFGDLRTDSATGRIDPHFHIDDRAPAARRLSEIHRAGTMDTRSVHRRPSEPLVGSILGEFGIPFECEAGWPPGLPVGALLVQFLDRLKVSHEAGQVLEITPET